MCELSSKQMAHDESLTYPVKIEKSLAVSPIREYKQREFAGGAKKAILSVEQMLGDMGKKATREMETQTESSCLKCNYCSHACV